MSRLDTPTRLILTGWGLVLLVAVLMVVARSEELGSAIAFAAIAVAMSAWLWLRKSRAAIITTLVLGILWTVQFVAYTVAGFTGEASEDQVLILIGDVVGIIAGAFIVLGATKAFIRVREGSTRAGLSA